MWFWYAMLSVSFSTKISWKYPSKNISIYVGTPEPIFLWSKDDHVLKYSSRIYLSTDNKTLNIEYIKESDAGLYTCIAENILGSDEASAQVDVVNSHGPPVLLFEPYDLEAIPGTTIEIPCGAEGGDPLPSVSFSTFFSPKHNDDDDRVTTKSEIVQT